MKRLNVLKQIYEHPPEISELMMQRTVKIYKGAALKIINLVFYKNLSRHTNVSSIP